MAESLIDFTGAEKAVAALSGVWGQVEPDEGMALWSLAQRTPRGLPIVEIGSLQGRSTCFLLMGLMAVGNYATLYAIDVWRRRIGGEPGWSYKSGPGADNLNAFLRNTAAVGYPGQIVPVESASAEIAKVWDRPIGLLHIDGDHSLEGVRADYEGFAKFVGPGGLLAIHDYRPGYDVLAYCDEVVKVDPTWECMTVTGTMLTARRAT